MPWMYAKNNITHKSAATSLRSNIRFSWLVANFWDLLRVLMWLRPRYRLPPVAKSALRLHSGPVLTALLPQFCTPYVLLATAGTRFAHNMAPSKEEKDAATAKGHKKEDIEGELNQWKFRPPYKIHDDAEGFKVVYEASCHCGRVKYQLNQEKPLDAKYCHCTTCQRLHGKPANGFCECVCYFEVSC